jgi:hypothetical protein
MAFLKERQRSSRKLLILLWFTPMSTGNRENRNNMTMLLHLAIVSLAEALAATRKFIANFTTMYTTNWIGEFRNMVSGMFAYRQCDKVLRFIVRMVVIFVVYVTALWRQLTMLSVVSKAMRGQVNAIYSLTFAFTGRNENVLSRISIPVLQPSVIVHGAPTAAKAQFFTTLDRAWKAGFVALCPSSLFRHEVNLARLNTEFN